ncbi:hypothetical protein D3C78_1645660 [compost metagenome]
MITLRSVERESGQSKDALPVEDVLPVSIDVAIEHDDGSYMSDGKQAAEEGLGMLEKLGQAEENWSAVDPAAAAQIASVIKQGWGIESDQLVIRQRADRNHSQ